MSSVTIVETVTQEPTVIEQLIRDLARLDRQQVAEVLAKIACEHESSAFWGCIAELYESSRTGAQLN